MKEQNKKNMPTSRVTIGFADFLRICHVDDPDDFGGFRVDTDGLYVILPDRHAMLTPEERAALSWHPTGHYDLPALPFPCAEGQLRELVTAAGLEGCIDEEEILAMTQMSDQNSMGQNKTPTSVDDWVVKAQAIAQELGLEQWARGIRQITARNMCDAVATELAKDQTTWGKQGARGGGNVRLYGLPGWKFKPPKSAIPVD